MNSEFSIHPLTQHNQDWVDRFLQERWSGPAIVSRGKLHMADSLPGFMAIIENQPAGLVTFHIESFQCEIVTLDSLVQGIGIGTALITRVKEEALLQGCTRLWLITTNDNLSALGFYQKRRFELVAVHRNALRLSRAIKPQIPEIGLDGIPLKDEIELELPLTE